MNTNNKIKANIDLPSGAKISIEGSPEDILSIIEKFNTKEKTSHYSNNSNYTRKKLEGSGIKYRISELIDSDFFKTEKSLSDIKEALRERGHIYPITSLSPAMVRLVRSGEIRRLRVKERWMYVRV